MKFLVKLKFVKDHSNYTTTLNFESPLFRAPCEILIHSANAIMKLNRCKQGEILFKYISQNRKEILLTMDPKESVNTLFRPIGFSCRGTLVLMKSKLKISDLELW